MDTKSKLPKERRGVSSMLNVAIEDLNLAKNGSGVAAAKAVFGDVSDLLPTIRVSPLSIRVCRSILTSVRRIQWSIGRIMLNWGWPVLMCVEPSTGD